MFISSGDIFTDTPRYDVLLVIWGYVGPVKLTHKTNHHRERNKRCYVSMKEEGIIGSLDKGETIQLFGHCKCRKWQQQKRQ